MRGCEERIGSVLVLGGVTASQHQGYSGKTMRWIKQEDRYGCGLAACAMIAEQSYSAVKAAFPADHDWSSEGYATWAWEQYLAEQGYALARMYRYDQIRRCHRAEWPPEPFGESHLCEVLTAHGAHMVVMLTDGVVLDPATPEPRWLRDYAAVHYVAAVVRM